MCSKRKNLKIIASNCFSFFCFLFKKSFFTNQYFFAASSKNNFLIKVRNNLFAKFCKYKNKFFFNRKSLFNLLINFLLLKKFLSYYKGFLRFLLKHLRSTVRGKFRVGRRSQIDFFFQEFFFNWYLKIHKRFLQITFMAKEFLTFKSKNLHWKIKV